MKLFIDANVIVYAVSDGPPHQNCDRLLNAIAEGRVDGTTSVNVLEEVWHLELGGRLPELAGQARRARAVFEEILPVTAAILDRAFAAELGPRIGANDRLHVATCQEHGIDTIVSADSGFDTVAGLRRIDPLDDALDALLS